MNLFQQLWKNWTSGPTGKQFEGEDLAWLNELNQAVFTQLQKRCPPHIQLRAVQLPAIVYYTEDEVIDRDGPRKILDKKIATVWGHRLIIPEGKFEDRVELGVQLLLELIDQPGTRTAFLYWPIVPEGVELHDGSPNRKYLKTRLRTTPNVVVDAPEGNT